MIDQRLREGAEAVKAALADTALPKAEELSKMANLAARNKVGWRGPLIAVATAAAVVAVVAATAFLFRGDGSTEEPTAPEVSTPVMTTPAFIGDVVTSWRVADVSEPWVHSIVDVASLPSGGFVAAVTHGEASVLWSPDGMKWVEADPQGQVSVAAIPEDRFDQQPQVISVSGDRVSILDEANLQVWVGDLEATVWEPVRLDTAGLTGSIEAAAIASNDRQVLVVAKWTPIVDEYVFGAESFDLTNHVVWLVDPATGGVERHTLPLDSDAELELEPEVDSNVTNLGLAAVWFQDRWVIAMGNLTAVSRDGTTWTVGWDRDGLAEEGSFVTALVAGADGLITTTCGGWGPHFTFDSGDGLDWTQAREQFPEQAQSGHGGAAYSDRLGFVMVFADSGGDDDNLGRMDYSQNGRNWSSIDVGLGDNYDVSNTAASGTSIFVDHAWGASLLTPEWGKNSTSAVTPPEWPEIELPTEMPAVLGAGDGQTVSVTVSGVSGRMGHELAGVLYEGGELTDLDDDARGGFWSVITNDDFATTEVLRQPGEMDMGRFPYVSAEALTLEPGTYTLVIWVDHALGTYKRWVPINTDGQGLYGCHVVFEVGNDTQTDIVVPVDLHPDGWNTNCATGATIPGTDAASAVTPPGLS